MCYESWSERKREIGQLDKARIEADKLIEQARAAVERKAQTPAAGETVPAAEMEKIPA